jgi:prepilin-type N-terminal cleavage/methylation domain-containing protein
MQLRRAARRAGDDRGITLIEMLIVIVLLGIIVAPLSGAMISYFKNTDKTTNRLAESNDVETASAYFAQDVASLGHRSGAPAFALMPSVESGITGAGGAYPCGTSTVPMAVRLVWDEPNGAATKVVRVAYFVQANRLHRIKCVDGATVLSDAVLARNVASVGVVQCASPGSTSCTTPVPETVTLILQVKAAGTSDTPIAVTLTGQRRQTT